MIEGILVSRATGGQPDNQAYQHLRRELLSSPDIADLLPDFVRNHRHLDAFWPFIADKAGTYAERRQIIYGAFRALHDRLDDLDRSPSDFVTSEAIMSFDADGVQGAWAKALARRSSDPEGAITSARTLLESVCKHILEDYNVEYQDRDDLPKLYKATSEAFNLAPSQHTEEPIKAILGGAMSLVNGLGTLRNRLSDSHGRGKKLKAKPSSRHASLAVNAAGAMATS